MLCVVLMPLLYQADSLISAGKPINFDRFNYLLHRYVTGLSPRGGTVHWKQCLQASLHPTRFARAVMMLQLPLASLTNFFFIRPRWEPVWRLWKFALTSIWNFVQKFKCCFIPNKISLLSIQVHLYVWLYYEWYKGHKKAKRELCSDRHTLYRRLNNIHRKQ